MLSKLVIISGTFPPDTGGPAKFSNEFGFWLKSKNFDVQVITYAELESECFLNSSFEVTSICRKQNLVMRIAKLVMEIGIASKQNSKMIAAGAFMEVYLASILYNFSYVVKVPGDIVWERARNKKITKLDIDEFQNGKLGIRYAIFRHLYSRSLKRAKFVIVPSVGLYKLCQGWGVEESKIRLIYNSVDPVIQSYEPLGSDIFNLVTVCRLVPWKGVDELIEYAASRKLKLLVVGDGPERMRLEHLASILKASVSFVGDIPHQEVHRKLLQSQLFVLNSRYEGLPHALVEARVAGVLSIARAGTGSAEVINDDVDGFLIRPNRSLQETIDMALELQPTASFYIERAKIDASQRFNKSFNYPSILKLILSETS
jgi:glycosyltransferase involved in cell wall biosynthesis